MKIYQINEAILIVLKTTPNISKPFIPFKEYHSCKTYLNFNMLIRIKIEDENPEKKTIKKN